MASSSPPSLLRRGSAAAAAPLTAAASSLGAAEKARTRSSAPAPAPAARAPTALFGGLLLFAVAAGPRQAAAQMFEIPAEMLQGMFGGGGGRQRQPMTEWPKTENSEVASDMEWLINTEWMGKTAKYLLLRDGIVESPLKECEQEGMCLWAANNGKMLINTPTLKVVRFDISGMDGIDRKKLENKDESELKKLTMVAEKPGKSGKKSQLAFSRVAVADETDNIIAEDLYKILDCAEDEEQGKLKSKFRRLSVQNHPDKGGDPQAFNLLREAYEVLGDAENRAYYDVGGMQLVKNIETAWKEVEGQKAQLDAQLNQVPKNHPQYAQFQAQVEAKKKQFDKARIKTQIESKLQSEDLDVNVPISAAELYTGVSKKTYEFRRLVICKGCRADPDRPECKDCGRCPPEIIQIPKYGMTPFGKQVVGIKEREQESREKCREVAVEIKDLRVPKGAKDGSTLKYVSNMGHQTPGKLPGKIVLKVQRGSPTDTYAIAESDLHTVLRISLEQALFGFTHTWAHLGDEPVTVSRERVETTEEVIKFKKKGLVGDGGQRGDLYVRLAIDLPKVAAAEKALSLQSSAASASKPVLEREDPIELREGAAWRVWRGRNTASSGSKAKKSGSEKEEL